MSEAGIRNVLGSKLFISLEKIRKDAMEAKETQDKENNI
jgi:hypothetical protein